MTFTLLLDFDSTFIQVETLDAWAALTLRDKPEVIEKIKSITQQGVMGEMSFTESLQKRIQLLSARRSDLKRVIVHLKKNITPSILRNQAFFKQHRGSIYIISGGFLEFIWPVVKPFGISFKQIFANTFITDLKGSIIGFDLENPLCKSDGKVICVKSLNLTGPVYSVGDGMSDYAVKEAGLAHKFCAFTENVCRKNILKYADHIIPNFDELLRLL